MQNCIFTTWNRAKIAKEHDLRDTIKEVLKFSQTHPLTKINIMGCSKTGKTTLAESITHLLHKYLRSDFGLNCSVQSFYYPWLGEPLQNQNTQQEYKINPSFEKFYHNNHHVNDIFKSLLPNNYIITLDDCNDASHDNFMKKADQILQNTAADHQTKIFLLKTYFNYAFDCETFEGLDVFRYFVNTSTVEECAKSNIFPFYVDDGTTDEFYYIKEKSNKKYYKHFDNFERVCRQKSNLIRYVLDNNVQISYKHKKPFIPCLFCHGTSAKNIVVPRRTFIDKRCSMCEKWHKMCFPISLKS